MVDVGPRTKGFGLTLWGLPTATGVTWFRAAPLGGPVDSTDRWGKLKQKGQVTAKSHRSGFVQPELLG